MTRRTVFNTRREPFTQWHRPGRAADVVVSVLGCAVLSFLSTVMLFAVTGAPIDRDMWRVIGLVCLALSIPAGLVRWAQIVAERAAERRELASETDAWHDDPHAQALWIEHHRRGL